MSVIEKKPDDIDFLNIEVDAPSNSGNYSFYLLIHSLVRDRKYYGSLDKAKKKELVNQIRHYCILTLILPGVFFTQKDAVPGLKAYGTFYSKIADKEETEDLIGMALQEEWKKKVKNDNEYSMSRLLWNNWCRENENAILRSKENELKTSIDQNDTFEVACKKMMMVGWTIDRKNGIYYCPNVGVIDFLENHKLRRKKFFIGKAEFYSFLWSTKKNTAIANTAWFETCCRKMEAVGYTIDRQNCVYYSPFFQLQDILKHHGSRGKKFFLGDDEFRAFLFRNYGWRGGEEKQRLQDLNREGKRKMARRKCLTAEEREWELERIKQSKIRQSKSWNQLKAADEKFRQSEALLRKQQDEEKSRDEEISRMAQIMLQSKNEMRQAERQVRRELSKQQDKEKLGMLQAGRELSRELGMQQSTVPTQVSFEKSQPSERQTDKDNNLRIHQSEVCTEVSIEDCEGDKDIGTKPTDKSTATDGTKEKVDSKERNHSPRDEDREDEFSEIEDDDDEEEDFYNFSNLLKLLKRIGWRCFHSAIFNSWEYVPPGGKTTSEGGKYPYDLFCEESEVVLHCMCQNYFERRHELDPTLTDETPPKKKRKMIVI